MKRARFVDINIDAKTVTLVVNYNVDYEEGVVDLARKKLGHEIDIDELRTEL